MKFKGWDDFCNGALLATSSFFIKPPESGDIDFYTVTLMVPVDLELSLKKTAQTIIKNLCVLLMVDNRRVITFN